MTIGSAGMVAIGKSPESACCSAHKAGRALVQMPRRHRPDSPGFQTPHASASAASNRRPKMSDAGLDFDLGEMAATLRDTTRRFSDDKIAPIAAEIDRTDEFPRHLWPQMG